MQEAHEVIEGDWFCSACEMYLDRHGVTHDERCDTCKEEVTWLPCDDDDDEVSLASAT